MVSHRLVFTRKQKAVLKWLIISTLEDFNKLKWECVSTNVSKVVKNKNKKRKKEKRLILLPKGKAPKGREYLQVCVVFLRMIFTAKFESLQILRDTRSLKQSKSVTRNQ